MGLILVTPASLPGGTPSRGWHVTFINTHCFFFIYNSLLEYRMNLFRFTQLLSCWFANGEEGNEKIQYDIGSEGQEDNV